jgi:formyl-CoA transferase
MDLRIAKMEELEVVASPIFTVEDMLVDKTFSERENIIEIEDPDLGTVQMQNVVPRLANHPGDVWRTAPALGEDNSRVYGGYLGIEESDLDELRDSGII